VRWTTLDPQDRAPEPDIDDSRPGNAQRPSEASLSAAISALAQLAVAAIRPERSYMGTSCAACFNGRLRPTIFPWTRGHLHATALASITVIAWGRVGSRPPCAPVSNQQTGASP